MAKVLAKWLQFFIHQHETFGSVENGVRLETIGPCSMQNTTSLEFVGWISLFLLTHLIAKLLR